MLSHQKYQIDHVTQHGNELLHLTHPILMYMGNLLYLMLMYSDALLHQTLRCTPMHYYTRPFDVLRCTTTPDLWCTPMHYYTRPFDVLRCTTTPDPLMYSNALLHNILLYKNELLHQILMFLSSNFTLYACLPETVQEAMSRLWKSVSLCLSLSSLSLTKHSCLVANLTASQFW